MAFYKQIICRECIIIKCWVLCVRGNASLLSAGCYVFVIIKCWVLCVRGNASLLSAGCYVLSAGCYVFVIFVNTATPTIPRHNDVYRFLHALHTLSHVLVRDLVILRVRVLLTLKQLLEKPGNTLPDKLVPLDITWTSWEKEERWQNTDVARKR